MYPMIFDHMIWTMLVANISVTLRVTKNSIASLILDFLMIPLKRSTATIAFEDERKKCTEIVANIISYQLSGFSKTFLNGRRVMEQGAIIKIARVRTP